MGNASGVFDGKVCWICGDDIVTHGTGVYSLFVPAHQAYAHSACLDAHRKAQREGVNTMARVTISKEDAIRVLQNLQERFADGAEEGGISASACRERAAMIESALTGKPMRAERT